jgi:thiol:disulfide interchange protein DsbD
MDYGYAQRVLLMVPLTVPSDLKDGVSMPLAARVNYLVCREVCIPGKKQVELSLPVRKASGPSVAREQFVAARRRLPKPVPHEWKVSAASAGDEFVLTLKAGHAFEVPQFFPLEEEQIENAAPQEANPVSAGVRLHLKKSKHLTKPLTRLRGVIVTGVEKAYLVDVAVSP